MGKDDTKLILPNNLLAEQIVLGTICVDPTLLSKVLQKLNVEAFYLPEHKIIYQAIGQLYKTMKVLVFQI